MVCNNNDNTTTKNHIIGDVGNNNESPKIEKKLKKNGKKDKDVDKNNKDTKINDVSNSEDSSEENIDNEKKRDTEIIFIQDLGFNVKIVCPGTEAFEIQVLLL